MSRSHRRPRHARDFDRLCAPRGGEGPGVGFACEADLPTPPQYQQYQRRSHGRAGASAAAAAAPEAKPRENVQVGEVDICFLGGTTFRLPVHSGELAAGLKRAVAHRRSVPPGMLLQLMHATGVLRCDDPVAQFAGGLLTAVYTQVPLSEDARQLLRRCTLQQPEEGRITLLEIRFPLSLADAEALAELAMQVQPRRLLLNQVSGGAARALAGALQGELCELEVLQMDGVEPAGIPFVTKIVSRCPALSYCYLRRSRGAALTADHVKPLRRETRAAVVI